MRDFIRFHAVDLSALPLAELFANIVILGSRKSLAQKVFFRDDPEMNFKEDVSLGKCLCL